MNEYSNIEHSGTGTLTEVFIGVGVAAATVGIGLGGYEIGSAINNALHITNSIGRGALDLGVMCLLWCPAYGFGVGGGAAIGGTIEERIRLLKSK